MFLHFLHFTNCFKILIKSQDLSPTSKKQHDLLVELTAKQMNAKLLTSSFSANDSPFSSRNRRQFGSNPSISDCGSCVGRDRRDGDMSKPVKIISDLILLPASVNHISRVTRKDHISLKWQARSTRLRMRHML